MRPLALGHQVTSLAASTTLFLVCVVATVASAQDPLPTLRPKEPLTVTLPAAGSPVASEPDTASSPVTVATFAVTPEGPVTVVHVWADPPVATPVAEPRGRDAPPTTASSLRLLLLDATTGATAAEGSGERYSPFLRGFVKGPRTLHVAIATTGRCPATATLHLRIIHETKATLAAVRSAGYAVTEIKQLLGAGDRSAGRERMETAVRRLSAIPPSARVSSELFALGRDALTAHAVACAHEAFSRVTTFWEEALPDDHPDLRAARGNLAITSRTLGRLPESIGLDEGRLRALSRTLPDDDPHMQRLRGDLAEALHILGRLPESLALQEKVLEVLSRTLPNDHPDLLSARGNLAITLNALGRLRESLALQEEVLAAYSRTLPDDHPALLSARNKLATALQMLGRLPESFALQEQVLEVRSRTPPDDHPELQKARANLANTLRILGRLPEALALQERVLEVESETLPDDHPDLQSARNNLAIILRILGRLPESLALQERILEVRSRTLSDDHPDLQSARASLASTLRILGRLPEALALQEKVLAALSRTLSDDHPDLQRARANLASTLRILGRLPEALALQGKALEVLSRTLPNDHPDLQRARANLANTLRILGRLTESLALREKVLEVRLSTLPTDHPDVQAACNDVAIALADIEDPRLPATVSLGVRHASQGARAVPRGGGFLADAGTVDTVIDQFGTTWALARFGGCSEPLREEAVRAYLSAQGAIWTSQHLAALMEGTTDEGKQVITALRNEQAFIAARITFVSQHGDTEDLKLESLVRHRERVADAINQRLRALPGAAALMREVGPDDIGRALQPGQTAVAFWRYRPFSRNPETGRLQQAASSRYAAWVIRADGTATDVDLALEKDLNELAAVWLGAVQSGRDGTRAGNALVRHLIEPLIPHLGADTTQLVCSLDGALHGLPLGVLPYGEGLLGDRWQVLLRPVLKELALDIERPVRQPVLVALGDPAFDDEPAAVVAASGVGGYRGSTETEPRFPPLPHSGDEVRSLAAAFKAAFGEEAKAEVLTDDDASRRQLLRKLTQARYLHLATHGYYEPVPEVKRASPLLDLDLGTRGMSGSQQVQGISPLILCGIALAGANLPPNDRGLVEGRLSGEEVASLDPRGCDLVVLSACDTAKGHDARLGPAIASLQTALHAAGARSAITAVWKVDDAVTQKLMTLFYDNLWKKKLPKHEALWRAQQTLRAERLEDGTLRYGVRDFGAWVLTGDPR